MRERRASARVAQCMETFVQALQQAGKPAEEIKRLSGIYLLRLVRE